MRGIPLTLTLNLAFKKTHKNVNRDTSDSASQNHSYCEKLRIVEHFSAWKMGGRLKHRE